MEITLDFKPLDARMILRVLDDERVKDVALEFYASPQLAKLIEAITLAVRRALC